jgi:hypothetical protein
LQQVAGLATLVLSGALRHHARVASVDFLQQVEQQALELCAVIRADADSELACGNTNTNTGGNTDTGTGTGPNNSAVGNSGSSNTVPLGRRPPSWLSGSEWAEFAGGVERALAESIDTTRRQLRQRQGLNDSDYNNNNNDMFSASMGSPFCDSGGSPQSGPSGRLGLGLGFHSPQHESPMGKARGLLGGVSFVE